MIDGISSRAFSATTLPPLPHPEHSFRETIINVSRERYGTPRNKIEEKIIKWSGNLDLPGKAKDEAPNSSQGGSSHQAELYEALCAKCGKWTHVVFKPDGVRPVYCKNCLKEEKEKKNPERPLPPQEKTNEKVGVSLKEAFNNNPTPFNPNKKERVEKEHYERQRKSPDLDGLRELLSKSDAEREEEYHEILENERK
jgi:CxxC-x17-CxxC domain-containing protein